MAARDNNIPVLMRCGAAERDASTGSHRFVDDQIALQNLELLVDVTAAEAADPVDKARILEQISATEGGAAGLSSDISGWISGANAADAEVYNAPTAAAKAASRSTVAAVRAFMCGEPEQLAALPAAQLAAAVRVAAAVGAEGALAALVSRDAPVDEPCQGGFTALMNAARAGWASVVPVLVGGGAEGNLAKVPEEATALDFAATAGRAATVAAILVAGAAVDKPRNDGATPLFMSAQLGHVEVVAALLAAGAAVDKPQHTTGCTPLMQSAQNGHAEIVAALLSAGAAVDKSADHGGTSLFLASLTGHAEVVKALLAAGAEKNIQASGGLTAMSMAVKYGHAEVVALLE